MIMRGESRASNRIKKPAMIDQVKDKRGKADKNHPKLSTI